MHIIAPPLNKQWSNNMHDSCVPSAMQKP